MDNKKIHDTVGEKLRRLRAEKAAKLGRKLTQSEVAAEANISRSHLGAAESRHANVSFSAIVRLAQYYDVSLDYLAGFSVSPFKGFGEIAHSNEEAALLRLFRAMNEPEREALTVFMERLIHIHAA